MKYWHNPINVSYFLYLYWRLLLLRTYFVNIVYLALLYPFVPCMYVCMYVWDCYKKKNTHTQSSHLGYFQVYHLSHYNRRVHTLCCCSRCYFFTFVFIRHLFAISLLHHHFHWSIFGHCASLSPYVHFLAYSPHHTLFIAS